jgi:hypothetical protein
MTFHVSSVPDISRSEMNTPGVAAWLVCVLLAASPLTNGNLQPARSASSLNYPTHDRDGGVEQQQQQQGGQQLLDAKARATTDLITAVKLASADFNEVFLGLLHEDDATERGANIIGIITETARLNVRTATFAGYAELGKGAVPEAVTLFRLALRSAHHNSKMIGMAARVLGTADQQDGQKVPWYLALGYFYLENAENIAMAKVVLGHTHMRALPLNDAMFVVPAPLPAPPSSETGSRFGAAFAAAGSSQEEMVAAWEVFGPAGDAPEHVLFPNGFPLLGYQKRLLADLPSIRCPSPDRVPASIDPKELFEKYINLNKPFIVEAGSFAEWAAHSKWTQSSLLELYGDVEVLAATKPLPSYPDEKDGEHRFKDDALVKKIKLKTYLEQVMSIDALPRPNEPTRAPSGNLTHPEQRYVFNTVKEPFAHDVEEHPFLIAEAIPPHYYHSPHHINGYFELALGPALSGAHMHSHQAAWNALISGKKRWAMSDLVQDIDFKPLDDGKGESVPALQWFQEKLLPLQQEPRCRIYEFEQAAGELVFVPDEYFHAVVNLEPGVAVSKQLGSLVWPAGIPRSAYAEDD